MYDKGYKTFCLELPCNESLEEVTARFKAELFKIQLHIITLHLHLLNKQREISTLNVLDFFSGNITPKFINTLENINEPSNQLLLIQMVDFDSLLKARKENVYARLFQNN